MTCLNSQQKKKTRSVGQERRKLLKIPEYKMYKDYGNHWCVHVAFTEAEAKLWKDKIEEAYSVHIEKYDRKNAPYGVAYAVYIHG